MINSYASRLADKLITHCGIDKSRKPIYAYGLELSISTAISMVVIVLLSGLLNCLWSSFLFLSIYFTLRLFAGGYHAKTHGMCFVTSGLTYLGVFAVSGLLVTLGRPELTLILSALACLVVIIFAPIKHKHHPLSAGAYKRNRKIALVLTGAFIFAFTIAYMVNFSLQILSFSSVTIAAVAVMMIIPKLSERRC